MKQLLESIWNASPGMLLLDLASFLVGFVMAAFVSHWFFNWISKK